MATLHIVFSLKKYLSLIPWLSVLNQKAAFLVLMSKSAARQARAILGVTMRPNFSFYTWDLWGSCHDFKALLYFYQKTKLELFGRETHVGIWDSQGGSLNT